MFWIVFFTSGYWFVTYKLQGNAYLLLPSVDNWGLTYRVFDAIFGIVLALRFLSIVSVILEQTSVDIFLIDWERQPKIESIKSRSVNGTEEDLRKDNIIVWRSLFLANEWNEMQIDYRYVRRETDMSTTSSELAPTNYILKLFLSAFIFLCIMAA